MYIYVARSTEKKWKIRQHKQLRIWRIVWQRCKMSFGTEMNGRYHAILYPDWTVLCTSRISFRTNTAPLLSLSSISIALHVCVHCFFDFVYATCGGWCMLTPTGRNASQLSLSLICLLLLLPLLQFDIRTWQRQSYQKVQGIIHFSCRPSRIYGV